MHLLRAELRKLLGNPMLTGFTVWIFPVGIGAFLLIGIVLSFLLETPARAMALTSSGSWTSDSAGIWRAVTAFPLNILGNLLPLAFMAVAFAGEYAWGTYRNVLPRAHRIAVLAAKTAALVLVLSASFLVTSILTPVGFAIMRSKAGLDYGPALTGQSLADFAVRYGQELLLGVLGLLVLAGFASLAAILTRSILGGLLAGFGLSVLEPMSFAGLALVSRLFDWPAVVELYRFTASYNLDNARAWFLDGHAFQSPLVDITSAPSLVGSLLILIVWIALLLGASAWIFNRQDIGE